jgi:hypothetical protein
MNISITEFEYNVMLDVYKKYPGLVKFSYVEEPVDELDYYSLWVGNETQFKKVINDYWMEKLNDQS